MIKHIVMFKLKGDPNSSAKQGYINTLKQKLEALPATISQIVTFEVGVNISNAPSAYDLVLVSEFNNEQDLEEYKVHPDHQVLLEYFVEFKDSVTVVDYIF